MAGETAHHLGRVLRAEPGQLYELSDGKRVWLARIAEVKRDRVEFSLMEARPLFGRDQVLLLLPCERLPPFKEALSLAGDDRRPPPGLAQHLMRSLPVALSRVVQTFGVLLRPGRFKRRSLQPREP